MNNIRASFKHFFVILQMALIFGVSAVAARAAGEVDQTFNASAYSNLGSANTAIAQPDGKIVIAGTFTSANGTATNNFARINTDGTLDTTFNFSEPITGTIASLAIQSNGKVLAAGNFAVVGTAYKDLIRLNANGSLDTSFIATFAQYTDQTYLTDVFVKSDDSIYVNGRIFENTTSFRYISRLDSNGNVDPSFGTPPFGASSIKAALQPDGKIVAADTGIVRLNGDGSGDSTFTPTVTNGSIFKITVQPDGKILIGGSFTTYGGFSQGRVSRLNSNGSLDINFNLGGIGANDTVTNIVVGADGKIIIAGIFTQYNGVARNRLARLNADGTLDTTFNPALTGFIGLQNDGKILVANANQVQRLNVDGTLDNSFNPVDLGYGGGIYAIVQQPDGKVIAGGVFFRANGLVRNTVVRYNSDGSVDTGFTQTAVPVSGNAQQVAFALALQPDGKILVGGQFSNGSLFRLNSDGTKDTSFISAVSGGIPVTDIDLFADGRILVNGTFKLETNGSFSGGFVTPTFQTGPAKTVVIQPDGKYLISGSFTQVNGAARGRIARLSGDGSVDTTFVPPLGANGAVSDIDLQPDGKIILGGAFTGLNGDSTKSYIGRLNSDGSLDASFSPVINSQLYAVKIQPDGKILISGTFTTVNGVSRNGYARLNADGTLDFSFNVGGGVYGAIFEFTLQTDNKILLGGSFIKINNASKLNIARLSNAPSAGRTRFDFDGDGRADLAVFRPSDGFWYQLSLPNNAFSARQFGVATDLPAPADYDGDGKTDIAVFREGAFGYFYIFDSSTNTFRYGQFGTTGDVPMSGDWDGDGKADLAVYRATTAAGGQSNFYYRPSSQPTVDYVTIAIGTAGDKPLNGDFDGDGRLDAALFRPSNATWYILQSSNNQVTQTTFGVATDKPVPADFDGDGRANIAVFRPSTGVWFTSTNPATNYGSVAFGATGDLPVPADYDGDGKADVAVFRPSTGTWYLLRSQLGFTGITFGANGDKPAPNAYVP